MAHLIEATRFTILVHTEINRLRRGLTSDYFYKVVDALDVPRSIVAAWTSRPEWHALVREAESLKEMPRCPNPNCGGPVEHVHDCGNG